ECRDIPAAFPDRGQRRLPEESGHAGFLDVPVSAEALQRLGGVDVPTLASDALVSPFDLTLDLVAPLLSVPDSGDRKRHDGSRRDRIRPRMSLISRGCGGGRPFAEWPAIGQSSS